MRKHLLKEATRASRIAARVSQVALTLPEDGPAPIMVCYQGAGEIDYASEHAVYLGNVLGWEGWTRENLFYSHGVDFIKTWNGVLFRIVNMEPIYQAPVDVRPEVFEALANTTT